MVAAAGDIKKMYYMVKMTKEDEFMQLFVWRWKGEEQIQHFAMTRLVMGNKPSDPISSVAVNEKASMFDFEERYPAAHDALSNKSYVDNTSIIGPNIEKFRADIKETEFVASKGGTFTRSGL